MASQRVVGRSLMVLGVAVILVGALGLAATGGSGTSATPVSTATAAEPTGSAGPANSVEPSLAPASAALIPPFLSPAPVLSSAAPSPTAAPETVAVFLDRWTTAWRTNDSAFLLARLNPIVTARYGVPACQAAIARQIDPKEVNALRSSSGPAPWTWVASGLSVPVSGVYTALIDRTYLGQTTTVTFHFAALGGVLTWFDACN